MPDQPREEFLIEKLLELRREENTRFWTVFSILSITNGVLINAAVAKGAEPRLVVGVAAVGLLLSISWTGIQARFTHWCKHWEGKIRLLEDGLKDRDKLLTESKTPPLSLSTKRGGYLNYLFVVAWVLLLIEAASKL